MAVKNFENWALERILGSGQFSEVELWKEKYTNKKIVIKKFLLFNVNGKSKEIERFEKELDKFKRLNHPNIVKSLLIPIEFKSDSSVLCMEFCNKGDLRKILNKPENACGLIYKDVLSIMKDISSSLKYLHDKNIIHCNIKPENIVLHELNGMIIYKLIDLGYHIKCKNIIASADEIHAYDAPEIFSDNKYTCSIDYWSIGILFFIVLTGYNPFVISNSLTCGKLEVYDYIIYPNDSPEGMLNNIIEWFQVALQCDPKQRGKCQNSDEVVIFPALNKILPTRIVYIFSLSSYRIDKCNISSGMTLMELQQWIEQTISIPIGEQIIADITGYVLNSIEDSIKLPIRPIPNSILYVYKIDILDIMLIEPAVINDHSLLRQCYTAIIYLMKRELQLFKHYIFALSTKFQNNKATCSSDYINNQVKILSESFSKFEEQKTKQLHDSEITTITKYLRCSMMKLQSLYEILNSAIELIQIYSNKFSKIMEMSHSFPHYVSCSAATFDNNTTNSGLSSITNDDAEIKDNIILRSLLDKYIQDIQDNWSKISL
ncbi:PREDICTED: inhibitor of nuclear factor kappa-B kinase subunit alpha-like [Ceratosolen solmsi marchali]|uniref:Inhibitor of nuclear factor kappa-B kinase subunit alpha-like n=1 Tax=Ceratosolen solmsi marchali TaxID=326594 RepID=A0AAJ6YB15_9HYME|nr:PREDICTED: inhibitor of nuclear factor kappa-B kinase subunit alpha-like [Ceratosolen solmsi marchali]